jgi:alkyl hydroperoxide reductase subunit AhpC
VLGVSVDSVFAHRAWAEQLGGLAFPLLADFHPKGAVARQFGVWREDRGVSKRAVFIIDPDGIIRWSKVYEQSLPDNNEILAALGAIAG